MTRRVLFVRTTDLVQRLQAARRELALEAAIAKLDRYDLLILDDIAYVTKDQAETNVLFELIAARYERRSMLITSNQPFGEWGRIFPDQAMTARRGRPPHPPRHDSRDERRELPQKGSDGRDEADLMGLARPVDAAEKSNVGIHDATSRIYSGHRDADQSLYWRSRRNSPLDLHRGQPAGARAPPGTHGTGGKRSLPAGRPVQPVYQSDQIRTREGYRGRGSQRRPAGKVVSGHANVVEYRRFPDDLCDADRRRARRRSVQWAFVATYARVNRWRCITTRHVDQRDSTRDKSQRELRFLKRSPATPEAAAFPLGLLP